MSYWRNYKENAVLILFKDYIFCSLTEKRAYITLKTETIFPAFDPSAATKTRN